MEWKNLYTGQSLVVQTLNKEFVVTQKNEECILLSSSKSYKKDASSDKSCSKTLIVSWVRSILSSQVYFAQLRFLHVTQQASIWRRKKHMLLSKHIWRTISIVQILFYSNSNAKSCKLRSLIWRFFLINSFSVIQSSSISTT